MAHGFSITLYFYDGQYREKTGKEVARLRNHKKKVFLQEKDKIHSAPSCVKLRKKCSRWFLAAITLSVTACLLWQWIRYRVAVSQTWLQMDSRKAVSLHCRNLLFSLYLEQRETTPQSNAAYTKKVGNHWLFPALLKRSSRNFLMKRHPYNSLAVCLELLERSFCGKCRKMVKKMGKREHHVWQKRESAGSGQKALNLLRTISDLPNEREAVYGALDKWIAWETDFPLIAAAKTLKILRKRSQWKRVIQVAKWMLSRGQGATMATYDTLLLAFDMDQRVDEAESLWNMILLAHTRSISKRLFSRMISLYDHHDMPEKIIEVFADMEELGVRPDEDTVRRVGRAFQEIGQEEMQKMVLRKYLSEYKYVHFKGERVRVKRYGCEEER